MKRKEIEEKLADLLHGRVSAKDKEKIIAELEGSGISGEEVESLLSVNNLVIETPPEKSVEKMDQRFYAMLEEEKKKMLLGTPDAGLKRSLLVTILTPGLKIAAGIALFLMGWFASGWFGPNGRDKQITGLTGEVKQLKETLILTMMQQSSSVDRIKAVNMIDDFDRVDNQIIEGLIDMLNHDTNDNLRLLALEVLIRYSEVPEVRKGLIASIGQQTSPLVQIRLTELMLALNEEGAVPEFKKILKDRTLNYRVRNRLDEAVALLL